MSEALLQMRGVTKRFPGVLALDNVTFDLRAGEVHCLLGENGAGKSTLMKVLAGAVPMDAGDITLDGAPIDIQSPHHAQQLGVSMIYQEFNLSPYQSVAENIFLGREPRIPHTPFVDWPAMRRNANAILDRIGVRLDVRKPVWECSVAQQQIIEIAKALSFNAKIIVMDEPSATLTDHEIQGLFALIRELKAQGLGLIYISHRLDEIFEIGDRVTVMRDGEVVATQPRLGLSREDLIRMMVGRDLKDEFPKEIFPRGAEILRLDSITRQGAFKNVSLSVHQGEVVGLTGLVGAGRTEVARAIFGADPIDSGQILLGKRPIRVRSPRDAIHQGIGLLTEDRKQHGLVLGMTVRENTTMAGLDALVRAGFIRGAEERRVARQFVNDLGIKTPGIDQITQNLSGGNQQKVVLAKWLFTQCRMLIFDEPTRGIDVGAKVEIYRLMNRLAAQGVGILVISSELPEILGMCDRIYVMHEGQIAGTLDRKDASQEDIMRLATGAYAVSEGATSTGAPFQ